MYINEFIKFKKEALYYKFAMETEAAILGQNNSSCSSQTGKATPSPLSLRKKNKWDTHASHAVPQSGV